MTGSLPSLTTEAIDNGSKVRWIVRAAFDIDGNFEVLEVLKGLGYGLDEAALAALLAETLRNQVRQAERDAGRRPG